MLTNKDIIESLENVGYNLDEISAWTKIPLIELIKMKNEDYTDNMFEDSLNQFFRMNMQEVEIGRLGDEEFRNTHLVMTPTGFKKVSTFTNEGDKSCIKIKFNDYYTNLTSDSQIQLTDGNWIKVSELKVGDKIKNYDDQVEVTSIENIESIDCCSITIDGDEYYLDGVITK